MAIGKRYGDWQVVDQLGSGARGTVYLARNDKGAPDDTGLFERLRTAVNHLAVDNTWDVHRREAANLRSAIRLIADEEKRPLGALKVLTLPDDVVMAAGSRDRMQREIETLRHVRHPALMRLLDANEHENWFVTEYFKNGSLRGNLDRYRAHVTDALRAFRPLVDGAALLHSRGQVHTDIRPANVFVNDSGALVLGDFGFIADPDPPAPAQSRDPVDDVYMLGKLLWSLVSGEPSFPAWYNERDEHDYIRLRALLPVTEGPEMQIVQRIFDKTMTQQRAKRLTSGAELLVEVDSAIAALTIGGQIPHVKRPMRCRFCGLGTYERADYFAQDGVGDPADRKYTFRCTECGHLTEFFWMKGKKPALWGQ